MGAAAADTLYGLAAAFSLTALTTFLVDHRTSFQLFGGLFMLGLGVATLRSRPVASTADRPAHHAGIAFVSAFAITATNPITVFAFIGIFAGLNPSAEVERVKGARGGCPGGIKTSGAGPCRDRLRQDAIQLRRS
jgi:hypothetical protein